MNKLLMDRTHPERLNQSQTVLFMKDLQKRAIPSNCLVSMISYRRLDQILVSIASLNGPLKVFMSFRIMTRYRVVQYIRVYVGKSDPYSDWFCSDSSVPVILPKMEMNLSKEFVYGYRCLEVELTPHPSAH